MADCIANLIKRAEAFLETHQGGTDWSREMYAERKLICDAIAEVKAAIEREEARAEVAAAREHMGVVQSALDAAHLEEVEDELGGLRAEIRRLDGVIDDIEERAWKALGEPEGTHDTTNVQRLCAEVARLRDMLALLCAAVDYSAPRYGVDEDWADLDTLRLRMDEAKALLAKHKETNQ